MNPVLLYALVMVCVGSCREGVDGYHAVKPDGLLLYSSLQDCSKDAKDIPVTIGDRKASWHYRDYCARIYFADYAQTERLLDGDVTCSYRTTMPKSVMARLLDPYRTHPECAKKAGK